MPMVVISLNMFGYLPFTANVMMLGPKAFDPKRMIWFLEVSGMLISKAALDTGT